MHRTILTVALVVAFLAATPSLVSTTAAEKYAPRDLLERTVLCLNQQGPCDQAVLDFLAKFAGKPGPRGPAGRDGNTPSAAELIAIIRALVDRGDIKLPAGQVTEDQLRPIVAKLVDEALKSRGVKPSEPTDSWWQRVWLPFWTPILAGLAALWSWLVANLFEPLLRLLPALLLLALILGLLWWLLTAFARWYCRRHGYQPIPTPTPRQHDRTVTGPKAPPAPVIGTITNTAHVYYRGRLQASEEAVVRISGLPALKVSKEFLNQSEPDEKVWAKEVYAVDGDIIDALITIENTRATPAPLSKIRLRDVMRGEIEAGTTKAFLKIRRNGVWEEYHFDLVLPANLDKTLAELHEVLREAQLLGLEKLYIAYTFQASLAEDGKPLPGEGKK